MAIVYGLGLSIYFGSWALRDNAALEVAVKADIPARELRDSFVVIRFKG